MIQKQDRRSSSRHEGEFRKCWSPSPGVILDVSPTGLAMETVKWVKPGEWIFVNTGMGSKRIGIPGEVRWIRQVASTRIGNQLSPVYHVGIAVFVEDAPPDWQDLVEECASRPNVAIEADRPALETKPSNLPIWEAVSVETTSD